MEDGPTAALTANGRTADTVTSSAEVLLQASASAPANGSALVVAPSQEASAQAIQWTAGKVFWTLGVFIFAGLAGTHRERRRELIPRRTQLSTQTRVLAGDAVSQCQCRSPFLLSVLSAEIGGGWLVWQTVRNKKPWFYALAGGYT